MKIIIYTIRLKCNGLIQMIRMDKSIRQIWVKQSCHIRESFTECMSVPVSHGNLKQIQV